MNKKEPFLLRFMIKKRPQNNYISAFYSEKDDLHVQIRNEKVEPLILTDVLLAETKTITDVKRERED